MKNIIILLLVILLIAVGGYIIAYKTTKTVTTPNETVNNNPTEPTKIAEVLYWCKDNQSINATYYEGAQKPVVPGQPPISNGSVQVKLSDGRDFTLAQTISASGARYANPDESFVFWNKGNGALVLEDNVEKSYIGCIEVAPEPAGVDLSQIYANSQDGFSIRLPKGYTADEEYKYQVNPGNNISGVKFTIPTTTATGTNLASDSYLSVEALPNQTSCTAEQFMGVAATSSVITEDGTQYSYATSSEAGAGNRYEESVYALTGTNPCLAVRYFIHYNVFENYPAGSVKEFDRAALLKQFDLIRQSLVVNQ